MSGQRYFRNCGRLFQRCLKDGASGAVGFVADDQVEVGQIVVFLCLADYID
jgi:hypothetical protein